MANLNNSLYDQWIINTRSPLYTSLAGWSNVQEYHQSKYYEKYLSLLEAKYGKHSAQYQMYENLILNEQKSKTFFFFCCIKLEVYV